MASMPPADSPVINLRNALERLGNDAELLRDLAQFYLEDAPPLIDRIQCAVEERNADMLIRSAHSLRGLSVNFDGILGATLSQQMETLGSSEDFASARQIFPSLCDAIDEIISALKTQVLTISGGESSDPLPTTDRVTTRQTGR